MNAQPHGLRWLLLTRCPETPGSTRCISAPTLQEAAQTRHKQGLRRNGFKAHSPCHYTVMQTAFPCHTLRRNWSRDRALKGRDTQTKKLSCPKGPISVAEWAKIIRLDYRHQTGFPLLPSLGETELAMEKQATLSLQIQV